VQGLGNDDGPTDAEIIDASIQDPQAFRDLFSRHFAPLFTYFARRLGRDAADDLTAEVFLAAFDRRAR
jgi:DNA-directed RNA polymerase specialized sigma24 family protein